MVETRLQEHFEIILVDEFHSVGEQAANLTVSLGVVDQHQQVVAQGGFSACEDDVRNARRPSLVHDEFPLVGAEFTVNAFDGGVLCLGVFGEAIGEGAVKPQGRRSASRMGGNPLEVQEGGGIQIGGGDQFVNLIRKGFEIRSATFLSTR